MAWGAITCSAGLVNGFSRSITPTNNAADTLPQPRIPGVHSLQLGAALGVTQLFGDLSSSELKPAVGITLTYPLSRTFSFQLLGDLGSLAARQQAFYNSRAEASFTQASLGASVDLSELLTGNNQKKRTSHLNKLSFYLAYGLIFFDATAYSLGNGAVQRLTNGPGSHRTASDNTTAKGAAGVTKTHEPVVPIGLRYSYPLSRSLHLTADLRYNFVYTDKLDATFDNDNSTIATRNGGDIFGPIPTGNSLDSWGSLSIGLTYRRHK